jgi:hypothetical protein
MSEQIWPNSAD